MAALKDICVSQGHTYTTVLRWETNPVVRKAIAAITALTGVARINAVAHGMLDGWRCAVTAAKGMTELNAKDCSTADRIRASEYYAATVIDPDNIELNEVNAAGFKPHTPSTGFIQYNTPASLTGITGRIRLKTKKGGTVIASNLVVDAPNNILGLVIDATAHTITITFPSTATIALAGKTGWYDVEMVSSDTPPVVTPLVSGNFTVEKE
jgi:hypothetical protein